MSRRSNLASLLGAALMLRGGVFGADVEHASGLGESLGNVNTAYVSIAVVLAVLTACLWQVRHRFAGVQSETDSGAGIAAALRSKWAMFGAAAIFAYVGAEVAIASLMINFLHQADVLGVPVVRPKVLETTALGAGYLAGLAVGYWKDAADVAANWRVDRVFEPAMGRGRAEQLLAGWKKAVERSFGWKS